jgi:hypothetical protein
VLLCLTVGAWFAGCGSGGGGGNGAGGTSGAAGQGGTGGGSTAVHKQAFITYSTYLGDEGVAAADAACNDDGAIAFSGRLFVAWVSTGTTSALARVGAGPWWLGAVLLGSATDLAANNLGTTFNRTPTGSAVATGEYVWTGTESGGVASADTCADWTSRAMTVTGEMGQVGYAGASWTAATKPSCDHEGHFYCLER